MNYSELVSQVESIAEDSIDPAVMEQIVRKAERQIFIATDMPAMRDTDSGFLSASSQIYPTPSAFLYPYSVSIKVKGSNVFLLNKDITFMQEAYPSVGYEGVPKHYAVYDESSIVVGPSPDDAYPIDIVFARYPQSIVDGSTSWLGETFDNALVDGVLLEIIRFQKGEQDVEAMYQNRYEASLKLFRMFVDGKLRRDTYRAGQPRVLDK